MSAGAFAAGRNVTGTALRDAVHAEWTKVRTTGGAAALVLASVIVTLGLGVLAAAVTHRTGADQDPAKISLTGIEAGQAIVAILAAVSITGEYSTGLMRISLTAMPRRITMLAAKAVLVTSVTVSAGIVAVGGSLLAGRLYLTQNGFTRAHGYAPLTLTDPLVLRAAVGSVLYLVLIALLTLGVSALVRDSASTIGVVLALLYVFPIIAASVTSKHWQRHLDQIGPMAAGTAIESTRNLNSLPIGPWAGLGVLAAWAFGALIVGAAALCLRDA